MSDTPEAARGASLLRGAAEVALGRERRIGSTVYGTVLVMAAVATSYAAERHDPLKLVELVVCAVVAFWLAYVYANALSESIQRGARLDRPLLVSIADRELGIVLAAIGPVLALLLGVFGVVSESTSIWLAIALGLAALFAQGYRYSRAARLGGLATAGILVANLVLGAAIVVLKVMIVH